MKSGIRRWWILGRKFWLEAHLPVVDTVSDVAADGMPVLASSNCTARLFLKTFDGHSRMPRPKVCRISQNPQHSDTNHSTQHNKNQLTMTTGGNEEDNCQELTAQPDEHIFTFPNMLCVLRIVATPFIGAMVLCGSNGYACIFFMLMGFTDMLDGLIARKFPSQRSLLGSILDPVADKFLISTLFVTLTYVNIIPLTVTVIVLCRDFLLVAGGLLRRYRMLESPITLRRFFDTTVSSIQIIPTKISKVNTGLQLLLVSASLTSPVFDFVDHPVLIALQFLTVGTTICSGLQYAFHNAMLRLKKRKY